MTRLSNGVFNFTGDNVLMKGASQEQIDGQSELNNFLFTKRSKKIGQGRADITQPKISLETHSITLPGKWNYSNSFRIY